MKRNEGKRIEIKLFRSNKFIYAQAIESGKIVASSSSLKLSKSEKMTKSQQSKTVGLDLAKKLLTKKINKAVLNKRNYAYLGRVKALTEGLREGGLEI